jgi:hypothetical protein
VAEADLIDSNRLLPHLLYQRISFCHTYYIKESTSSVTTSNSIDSNRVMDSGCTYHMTPRRDWFTSYEEVDDGLVSMENNYGCKIIEISTVIICMHYDIVRTLTEVHHVPHLKKNLISLGTLVSHGLRIMWMKV